MSAVTAWRGSTDGRVGVAVGDVADLVLLADDPLATGVPSEALRSMPVLATCDRGTVHPPRAVTAAAGRQRYFWSFGHQ